MAKDFSSLKYQNKIPKNILAKRLLWELVWLTLFRPTPRWLMHSWRRLLLRIFGAKIGKGSKISPSCFIWAPWNLTMGEYSALGDNVDCYSMDKITIGSKVAISQRSFLCTGSHDAESLKRPLITAPIKIEDHTWVAAESMVFPGVTISQGTIIGARSVVVKNLPAWSICAGNPCRFIKHRTIKPEN